MVEAQCSVQLCFPVELKNEKMVRSSLIIDLKFCLVVYSPISLFSGQTS